MVYSLMEFRYERFSCLSSLIEKGECYMTFTNNKLEYRVTLDTNLNLFIVFDKQDENKFATGTTIENAVQELAKIA